MLRRSQGLQHWRHCAGAVGAPIHAATSGTQCPIPYVLCPRPYLFPSTFVIARHHTLATGIGTCNHHILHLLTARLRDSVQSQAERRYRKLLLTGVDFTKDGFFFSHSYNLADTLQANMAKPSSTSAPFANMFVWNEFLTRCLPLPEITASKVDMYHLKIWWGSGSPHCICLLCMHASGAPGHCGRP